MPGSVREHVLGVGLALYCVYAFVAVAMQAGHVDLLAMH